MMVFRFHRAQQIQIDFKNFGSTVETERLSNSSGIFLNIKIRLSITDKTLNSLSLLADQF